MGKASRSADVLDHLNPGFVGVFRCDLHPLLPGSETVVGLFQPRRSRRARRFPSLGDVVRAWHSLALVGNISAGRPPRGPPAVLSPGPGSVNVPSKNEELSGIDQGGSDDEDWVSNTRAWCHEPDQRPRMVTPTITYLSVCLSFGISLMHLRGGWAIFSSQLSAHPRDEKIEKKIKL